MRPKSEGETAIVASLPKGSALWKVGDRSFQAEDVLSAWEREITWMDERIVNPLTLDRSRDTGHPPASRQTLTVRRLVSVPIYRDAIPDL